MRDLATDSLSAMGWHRGVHAGANARGPTPGDGLDPGVKANTFHAMHVVVAKQRALPAAKAMERHGHRDGNIDADHADLHLVGKARAVSPSRVKRQTPLPNS